MSSRSHTLWGRNPTHRPLGAASGPFAVRRSRPTQHPAHPLREPRSDRVKQFQPSVKLRLPPRLPALVLPHGGPLELPVVVAVAESAGSGGYARKLRACPAPADHGLREKAADRALPSTGFRSDGTRYQITTKMYCQPTGTLLITAASAPPDCP
jgi:hypothetical protein